MMGVSVITSRSNALLALCLVAILCVQGWALTVVERLRPPAARAQELSYLPSGDYLKVAVLGYRQLAADLIWLKTIQYLGERTQTKQGYRWAYRATDVLTDLDPKFSSAYLITGMILGIWANLPDETIAILEKGAKHNPEVWQLPYMLGYEYYYEKHEPGLAAKYFQMASGLEGAPAYLTNLAARMTVEAGSPEAALEFLQRMYLQVQDEQIREGLANRIRQAQVERDIHVLERSVAEYRTRYGKLPGQLEDLVRGGMISRLPDEPFGGQYMLSPEGTVNSTMVKERFRVYRPH